MSNQQKNTVPEACEQAREAFSLLSGLVPEKRANLLDALAAALDARRDEILKTCADETALTIDELTPEFARMTGTLRMFGQLVREGSWVRAAVDTKQTQGLVGPNHDIRSMLVPLGPVAVFGSSNFPLAYGMCGGDTASALAAGCPVVVKEHPAHPRTGRLLAEIAQGTHQGHFSEQPLRYVLNEDPADYSVAQQLVQNMWISAVGFTGSTTGGLALERLCKDRYTPIPIFAEMGSLNCVFVARGAFAAKAEKIADELVGSVLSRVGQQCTKPGLVFVPGKDEHIALYGMIRDRLLAAKPRRMLASTVAQNYYRRLDEVAACGCIEDHTSLPTAAERASLLGVPVLFSATDTLMETYRPVWEEIFGPALIVARYCGSAHDFIPNGLTVTVYAENEDTDHPQGKWDMFERFQDWLLAVRRHAGRVIFNGVPTGVRVATGMVHGGPFPATNVPHTTAVGPRAIERWCRPVCWQNCPDGLLPEELRDGNPRGVMRVVDGVWTRDGIGKQI